MPSTFFGLNIGASGLRSFQVAVNTTANNIANVQTKGYTRQQATLAATTALRVTARYGSIGTGVNVTQISQIRDEYYDTKFRENNSCLGRYEQKLYYMDQIETYFKDDVTVEGFSTIFSKMFADLDSLKTNAADMTTRSQFINSAQSLCTYFNSMAQNLSEIQDDCNEEIKNATDQINSISQKISLLNKEINQVETGTGAVASVLRDERANLLDELSKIVTVTTSEYQVENTNNPDDPLGGTHFTVFINGEKLVNGNEYRTLECVASETKKNMTDNEGLYDIYWTDTDMPFSGTSGTASGTLKGLFEMRDGDNAENLKGKVIATDVDNNTVTIGNVSASEINELNLPPSGGTVTVNGRTYSYESWEAVVDKDGVISEIKFNLGEQYDQFGASKKIQEMSVVGGLTLSSGSGLDTLGVPYHMAQLNQFVRNFTQLFNEIENKAEALNGDNAVAFFEAETTNGTIFDFAGASAYRELTGVDTTTVTSSDNIYYQLTAASYKVNSDLIDDPSKFGTTTDSTKTDAYDIVEELLKLQSDTKVYRGDKASSFLETIIADVSVDTEKATIYYKVYNNLSTTIDNQRTSISGVDEDEEALNLVKFQNAYNMNSKIISVMAEMIDKLINETGV